MRIRGNWLSLQAWRAFNLAGAEIETSQRKLSSGLRVTIAADDVAAVSISQQLMGQVRGLIQASKNAMEGISLLNVAEGALQEVHAILQRCRQLSLQAANDGTLTSADKQYIQEEINQLLVEIDRITDNTVFNDQHLLNSAGNSSAIAAVVDGLRSGWLEVSAQVINTFYGLVGDGTTLNISLEQDGAQSAWITGTPGVGGRLDNLTLHINLTDFGSVGGLDGGTGPFYNDRKVARALTQAVLARSADFVTLEAPSTYWFISGASDYVAGADEQLAAEVAANGAAGVVAAFGTPWTDDSLHQSAAYLAVKYLEWSSPGIMNNLMGALAGGMDLDTAMSIFYGGTVASFTTDFLLNGVNFLTTQVDLADADVGGIGGGDASGVIPNTGTYSLDPLLPAFSMNLAVPGMDPLLVNLQVGANQDQMIELAIPHVSTFGLGLVGIDVVSDAGEAVSLFGRAISSVSGAREYLGSMANRLDKVLNVNGQNTMSQLNGYSKLVDVDYAAELANLTREQILVRSSAAMLAQANTIRQHVMWLLKDLSTGVSPREALPHRSPTNKPARA